MATVALAVDSSKMSEHEDNEAESVMVGATVPGIEDYRDEFLEHSDSELESASLAMSSLNVANLNKGIIRESFQSLLPHLSHNSNNSNARSRDKAGGVVEEEPPNADASSQKRASSSQKQKQSLSEDEADDDDEEVDDDEEEDSTSATGSASNSSRVGSDGSSSEDGSGDDDDDDADDHADERSEHDESSSWGSADDDDHHGHLPAYLAVLKQENAKSKQFALTPFESVVDNATKCLKTKIGKITFPMMKSSNFFSDDLAKTGPKNLQYQKLVEWIQSDQDPEDHGDGDDDDLKQHAPPPPHHSDDSDSLSIWLRSSLDQVYSLFYRSKDLDSLLKGYELLTDCIFAPFEHYISLSEAQQKDYALFKLFEMVLHMFARLSSKLLVLGCDKTREFETRLKWAKKTLFPAFEGHLELLRQTYKAHTDRHSANHCIQSFVRIYYEHQRATFHKERAEFELCVKALVALDLYMENYSPLNHSILSDAAAYDIESEAFKWLDTGINLVVNKQHQQQQQQPVHGKHGKPSKAANSHHHHHHSSRRSKHDASNSIDIKLEVAVDDADSVEEYRVLDDDVDSEDENADHRKHTVHVRRTAAAAASADDDDAYGYEEDSEEDSEEDDDDDEDEDGDGDENDRKRQVLPPHVHSLRVDIEEEEEEANHRIAAELGADERVLYYLKLELCSNPQLRISKLMSNYGQFRGISLLRSRVLWVIGHSKLYHERDFIVSERCFFESLYCLKKLTKFEYFPLSSTMYTELASLLLIDYADALLENKKYQYAIVALEKVIDCLEQRQRSEQRFEIIRKLCITCTEKEDWKKAIKYHNQTLRKLKDNYLNLNEFVYLSQQISTIHLKLNNFSQSEMELQNGIRTIYRNALSVVKTSVNDGLCASLSIEEIFARCQGEERMAVGSLVLALANLYISSGNHVNVAIRLLTFAKEQIFASKNAATRHVLILFQLARGHFKRARYAEAATVIQDILSKHSAKNNKLLSSLEFVQLRVLVLIHCRPARFRRALALLDKTMDDTVRKESFVKRAKINYMKGRVLQTRCFHKLIEKYHAEYDSSREEEEEEKKEEEEKTGAPDGNVDDVELARERVAAANLLLHQLKRQHVRGGKGGDFMFTPTAMLSSEDGYDIDDPLSVQSTFLLSHSDYRRIQDPIMLTKCCLELGKTYLEILMEYYALPTFVLRNLKYSTGILMWLGYKIFNDNTTPIDEIITHCLEEIHKPLHNALDLSCDTTKDIPLLIESYVALAEYEFLKTQKHPHGPGPEQKHAPENANGNENDNAKSKRFWTESKKTFFLAYKDSDDWVVLRRIDRYSRKQLFALLKRILRLLICYDNQFIADNVDVLVSYTALETFMVAQNDLDVSHVDGSYVAHGAAGGGSGGGAVDAHHHIANGSSHITSLQGGRKHNDRDREHHHASTNFSRLNSAPPYHQHAEHHGVKGANANTEIDHLSDEEKLLRNASKNPTVTLRIEAHEQSVLSHIQGGADASQALPLHQRYRNYHHNAHSGEYNAENPVQAPVGGERELDEIFRMHWKMRTEANMFSGGRMVEIDNDKSVVHIAQGIDALNVKLDINASLHRRHRCWSTNETFVVALDSIVFMFHPHTLTKSAVFKKRDETPKREQLQRFIGDMGQMAFHDNDFLPPEENPWIDRDATATANNGSSGGGGDVNKPKPKLTFKQQRQRAKKVTLSEKQLDCLQNKLSLPFLKLESIKELLMCLDPQNILTVLGAIFNERRVIMVSRERCRALAIMDALFVLMYPFAWQFPCIPWLSPYCLQLVHLDVPYIFGVPNIDCFNDMLKSNTHNIRERAIIIDLDSNRLIQSENELPENGRERARLMQLPLKIKSKLTRAMFRLMSGLLKNTFYATQRDKHWLFPPRRRDNVSVSNDATQSISNQSDARYNLLTSPYTAPISMCSERKSWFSPYKNEEQKQDVADADAADDGKIRKMVINFQKEFCTAWVEVLEQYRLFWVKINSAIHDDVKSKSTERIQKYAHPRYRKFLTELQRTRMFSSFQCIRSLATQEMLEKHMFDNLVLQSLLWRQSLYRDIVQQQQSEHGQMRVSVENSKRRQFTNLKCHVAFAPKDCKLFITPNTGFLQLSNKPDVSRAQFDVYVKANDYELESDDVHKRHPYIDPKQVENYGERYQLKIKHQEEGILTLNCKNYYELTRWIHMMRTHSMDTWYWSLKW